MFVDHHYFPKFYSIYIKISISLFFVSFYFFDPIIVNVLLHPVIAMVHDKINLFSGLKGGPPGGDVAGDDKPCILSIFSPLGNTMWCP